MGAGPYREIAAEMDISLEEYGQMLESVAGSTVFSLDDESSFSEPANNEDVPLKNIQKASTKKKLAEVIGGLPEQETLVVALYYDKGMNLREIGEVLGVSESRVCQIHTRAIGRIRSRMRECIENSDL